MNSSNHIFERVHIRISGFTQHLGKPTGMRHSFLEDHMKSPGCVLDVLPQEWDYNPEHFAQFIHDCTDENTVICVAAYSWGGGRYLPRFAAALMALGRVIDYLVLVDPVYRSGVFPHWLPANPVSYFTKWGKIKLTDNVMAVSLFRQEGDRPKGREVKGIPQDRIKRHVVLEGVNHEDMDDHPEVQQEISYRFKMTEKVA